MDFHPDFHLDFHLNIHLDFHLDILYSLLRALRELGLAQFQGLVALSQGTRQEFPSEG